MRELKFRAWTRQNPPMPWSQKFIAITGNGDQMIPIGGTFTGVWHALNDGAERLIIEQYTGLKDKFGKEIYEGDIVLDYYDGDDAFIVEWDKDIACFRLTGTDNIASVSFDNFDSDIDLEVIGNIHENPELLEEEE